VELRAIGYEVNVPPFKKYGWKAVTVGLGALTGLVTRHVLEFMWKALRGSTPPKVPADRRSSWVDALSWAIATGTGVAVARLLAVRTAAAVWEAAVHEPPPEPALVEPPAA
jgi:Protein of unknown function (DUF4235)